VTRLLLSVGICVLISCGCGRKANPSTEAETTVQEQALPMLSIVADEQLKQAQTVAVDALPSFLRIAEGAAVDSNQFSLGSPFPVVWLSLNNLQQLPTKPESLLENAKATELLYPVLKAQKVHAALRLSFVNGKWSIGAFEEDAASVEYIVSLRASLAKANAAANASYIVSVPAMNFDFMATRQGQQLVLRPLDDNAPRGFKTTDVIPANELLQKLKPFAEQHDGLPR